MVINQKTAQVIATYFGKGRIHDFRLLRESGMSAPKDTRCLADSGYQGLAKLHTNSETPYKKSKNNPLTKDKKRANRQLSRRRILVENVIGKLKVFRILSERYRNRRKRFSLRFNLIAAIHNLELHPA